MRTVLLLVPLLCLPACFGGSTPPSHFYALTPLGQRLDAAPSPLVVAVGPVVLPSSLDRPQIVTRVDGNELHVEELHRWIEPLDEGLARVIGENLVRCLEARDVVVGSRSSTDVDRRVAVTVLAFDAQFGYQCELTARWVIYDGAGAALVTRRSTHRARADAGYTLLVEAMSEAVAALSAEIAQALVES
jgi:uncharacterized lipoprotein YmbA